MKKLLMLLAMFCVAIPLSLSLAGCGGPSSTPTGVDDQDTETLSEEQEAGEEAIGQE